LSVVIGSTVTVAAAAVVADTLRTHYCNLHGWTGLMHVGLGITVS
jgi:hypothetical protein